MADDEEDAKKSPGQGMPPGLVSRSIPSQNVVSRLMYREMFGSHYRSFITSSEALIILTSTAKVLASCSVE